MEHLSNEVLRGGLLVHVLETRLVVDTHTELGGILLESTSLLGALRSSRNVAVVEEVPMETMLSMRLRPRSAMRLTS